MKDGFSNLITEKKMAYMNSKNVFESGVFDFRNTVPIIEDAYKVHYIQDFKMPILDYLKYKNRPSYDRIIVLLGYLGGDFNVSGIKEICSSTRNSSLGFPRASGLIILNDNETQRPFAVLEASQISAARTTAVTAVSLKYLKPKSIEKVAFIGCGYLARIHAMMWDQLCKDECNTLHLYDSNDKASDSFAKTIRHKYGLDSIICNSAEEAVRDADIIIPMTTEETPYIKADWIKEDSLYSAVSLLDPELDVLRNSDYIVVDDEALCKHEGRPLQKLEESGDLKDLTVYTIGEVISKSLRLRKNINDRIFFNPMGTILTDLALSLHVLNNAKKNNKLDYLEA